MSQLSMNSTNSSRGYFIAHSSHEEDEDLERTLNSHGSTLLDVYPSMLNQIRESYRRQHVTKAASAVLRRYRHQRLQLGKEKHRSSKFSSPNYSFNSVRDSVPKRSYTNPTTYQGRLVPKGRPDPRNASNSSNECFYSPRRDDAEIFTHLESKARLYSQTKYQPLTVLDLSSSPDSSSPRSLSPDLNQTYTLDPESGQSSGSCISAWSWCEPKAGAKGLTEAPQEAKRSLHAYRSPKLSTSGCQVGKYLFRVSPMSYRGVKSVTRHGDGLAMPLESYKQSNLERNKLREHIISPASSLKQSLIGSPRSPLKPKIIMPYTEYRRSSPTLNTSPKQIMSAKTRCAVNRSPHNSLHTSVISHHSFPPHQEKLPLTLAQKRQRSLSGEQARIFDVSQMSSLQIDAEFTRLYHHFVCRGSFSSLPNSSCHICRSVRAAQHPGMSSSSMSALALTPVRTKLKRRRQPEFEESLQNKRFRESCSPHRPKQQASTYVNYAMTEPSEDKRTWNRALLLQCPSPRFLRTSGGFRKVDLQRQQNSPFWVRLVGLV